MDWHQAFLQTWKLVGVLGMLLGLIFAIFWSFSSSFQEGELSIPVFAGLVAIATGSGSVGIWSIISMIGDSFSSP